MDAPLQRREFKYLLDLHELPHLQRLLAPHCRPDPYAGPDGTYLIRSLYLDTWDYRLFLANEREAPVRYKARVRTYPEWPGAPVFLEIKSRVSDVIHKTRAKVARDGWTDHLRAGCPGAADPALQAFQLRASEHGLQPTALVQYARYAWKGIEEDYARVSVDVRIQCQERHRLDLEASDRYWRPIDSTAVTLTPTVVSVLELKFAGTPPWWMQSLVQQLDLIRHSYSKYCNAVRSTLPPVGPRRPWRRP